MVSKNICLVSYLWDNILISFSLPLKSELLKLECAPEPPVDLVEMQVHGQWVWRGARDSAFLTTSQEMLMLPVLRPTLSSKVSVNGHSLGFCLLFGSLEL